MAGFTRRPTTSPGNAAMQRPDQAVARFHSLDALRGIAALTVIF
jgi:hypothetical protein